jgi:hypothetical protein
VINTLEATRMENQMVRVFILGPMVVTMKVNSRMDLRRVKANGRSILHRIH